MNKVHHILLATASGILSSGGHAQDVPEDYFDALPVVLSASRLVQSADDAPATVTVIDRTLIDATGARDLVELFRLVPGMVVGQFKGGQATIGFHGIADPYFRQLQVLIDGVSIYSPIWGGTEWNQLPVSIDDVERIEIVRGPNAATFGANSFLGVVNIITRDPRAEHGTRLSINVGDDGIFDAFAGHSIENEDVSQRIAVGHRSDRGLPVFPDNRSSDYLNLRGHFTVSSRDEIRWQGRYTGGKQGQGVYATPNHTDGARTAHFDAGSVQVRWTRAESTDEESWLQFSHAERSHREQLPFTLVLPEPIGNWDYPLDFSYKNRRTDLEGQHSLRFSDWVRFAWGGQVRRDESWSPTYLATDDWKNAHLYRIFGNAEWRPDLQWIVALGLMWEKNTITGASLSPSLAVNYQLANGHTIRIRTARARRTPTLFENEFDWRYELPDGARSNLLAMPDPYQSLANLPLAISIRNEREVEDERILSKELAYLTTFPAAHLNAEFDIFEHKIDDLIQQYRYDYPTVFGVLDSSQPSRYKQIAGFDNLGSARVSGQSLSMRWAPPSDTLLYLTAARTKIHANGPFATAVERSAPRISWSILASQRLLDNWHLSAAYYRMSPMAVMSGGDLLPSRDQLDLKLAHSIRMDNADVELAVVVRNASGDVPMFEVRDVAERTAWLTLMVKYR